MASHFGPLRVEVLVVLRLNLSEAEVARLDRLRGSVRLATRRNALLRELVRVGLDVAEREPERLVRPAKESA